MKRFLRLLIGIESDEFKIVFKFITYYSVVDAWGSASIFFRLDNSGVFIQFKAQLETL